MLIKYTTGDKKKYKELKENWNKVYNNKNTYDEEPKLIAPTKNPKDLYKEKNRNKIYEENDLTDNKEWRIEYKEQEIVLRHIVKYKLYQLTVNNNLITYGEEKENFLTGRITINGKKEIITAEIKKEKEITIKIGQTIIYNTP